MSKYKKGDKFEIEIESVVPDCLGSDACKIKNLSRTALMLFDWNLNYLKQIKPQTSKYDCSKALDYSHEQIRMCAYNEGCDGCPLYKLNSRSCYRPDTQEGIDALQAWSDAHPEKVEHEKTLKEDFFKKFPDAERSPDGNPKVNPCDIYGEANIECSDFECSEGMCWDIPLSEVQHDTN